MLRMEQGPVWGQSLVACLRGQYLGQLCSTFSLMKDGVRLFSAVSSDETWANRHKLKNMKSYLNTRKHFFFFSSKPDWACPFTRCFNWPCWNRGVGLDYLKRSFQPRKLCHSVNLCVCINTNICIYMYTHTSECVNITHWCFTRTNTSLRAINTVMDQVLNWYLPFWIH